MKAKIIFFTFFNLMICNILFSQNITNTLGSNGTFTIKYGAINFLTLSQLTGSLNLSRSLDLPNTTSSSIGVISKGSDRFLHNYGDENLFSGVNSGNFTMTGYGNSAFGNFSLYQNTSGNQNLAFGNFSLYQNTSGNQNLALGYNSLYSNTFGSYNTAVGNTALSSNTTGYNNSAFGYGALGRNTTGGRNSAFGYFSLSKNTTGDNNSAFGFYALEKNTTGIQNLAFGYLSLSQNTMGSNNTAVGYSSLVFNTGSHNNAVGSSSLYANTTGEYNSAFGNSSMSSNTTGHRNAAFGNFSLLTNTSGFMNSAFGYDAGTNVTTGSNLVLVGYNSQPTTGSATNQITLGNNQITSLRCNVLSITSLSDARDKKNISELSLGLDFITKLKPRQFNWDKREWYDENISDGSKMTEAPTAGFIAQELDSAQTSAGAEWLNLVLKDNPEKWEATYGNLLPVIVKAIQELRTEKDSEIAELRTENNELKNKLAKFEVMQSVLAGEIEKIKSNNPETKEIKLTEK